MAGNEGTSQTELWSSVVHQPSEDPEESELPSTVDMAAFSSGLTVEPANPTQNHTNTDSESDSELESSNSGSEVSRSGTQSDSSDTDSSTSSLESSSRSPSPEFSVTTSQTNSLRLTIATVRKASGSPTTTDKMTKTDAKLATKNGNCSSSSESPCSSDSESDSECSSVVEKVTVAKNAIKGAKDNNVKRSGMKTRTRNAEKKEEKKVAKKETVNSKGPATRAKARQKKKKMASLPVSRGSTYSSSDSEDSDADRAILASCSLQEIRQEDLAAILPDQQECDAFGDFECPTRPDKSSPQTGGDQSGSDMEIPQQALNALIQRTTESSSESECPHLPPNPSTLHANSLLQQFVAQTQLLNAPMGPHAVDGAKPLPLAPISSEAPKRKRGRPRKSEAPKEPKAEYLNPNVSPDSGIQNSPDHVSSPEPPKLKPKKIPSKKNINKPKSLTSNRFDRLLYANTDRVLYPPRRKVGRPPLKKGPGRPPKHKPPLETKPPEKSDPKPGKKVTYTTLKNSKVMHSRHKHKKHKKYKFKILRSNSETIKTNVDIDQLVSDFVKLCVIGTTSKPKDVPEVVKAKKVSKKRKTTEHSERKKKKVHLNATVNKVEEQRLPLKKRHYLFSDGKSNVKQIKIEEPSPKEEKSNAITATTPKKRHRMEIINSKEKENPPVKSSVATLTENTKLKPKPSLESLISELKMKRGLSNRNILATTENKTIDEIPEVKPEITVEPIKSTVEVQKKKVRKRRAINRTGFPTIKKKKKKVSAIAEPETVTTSVIKPELEQPKEESSCDRVPKVGEECEKFIERTDSILDDSLMSECESLPLDERTELDLDSGEEITLEASIERLRSRLDKKKRKRGSEKIVENPNGYPKRRLRDVSPASSIEPLERRLRDERASLSGDEKKNKKVPRWRKRYLVAGLFSSYFKVDDETSLKRSESAAKSRLVYNPSEHPYGLLPPPYHCGKYLRCKKAPFRLPYDLWWQHTHSQLPGRDVVPSWNYRKIRTNVYNVKTTTGACEPQNCNCTSSANCGDDCINRLVLAECPASHKCHNQKIQRHEWSPGIEKFMTELKGWGVRTKLPIKSADFILEYVGEVVSDQEFKERMATIYGNDTHHYCLHLDGGLVIDGHRMGGDGRFVNHSCQPNCEIQKWSVNGQFRMALFALRDIESGEELTYDYNFSLFNPAEGQECKCGSDMCRGVIGGKSQRVRQLPTEAKHQPGRVGRPRKNQAKRAAAKDVAALPPTSLPIAPVIPVKPMSHQQKCFILEHHCFLLRNLTKVRKLRDRSSSSLAISRQQSSTPTNHSANFINHLNALEKPRNIRTRRLAQAEDNVELSKTVKLASVLKDIWNTVTKSKDTNEEVLSTHFMTMPSKRKVPEFYQTITDPIDLSTIEQNIATGVYISPEAFNADMNRLFNNYIRFYGRSDHIGVAATKLKKIFMETKQQSLSKFEDLLGIKPPHAFSNKNKNEEEDIIRCICGIPNDEGLMIQCERCMVWQHSECVNADVSAESYHCEQCVPRKVDYEIPMDEYTEHGHKYYMTLLRGELQLRQGDTVYVLRDIPIPGSDRKHTYDTIGKIEFTELDIFRIERLWKDSKTGQRFAYGHHYLRPHETYHEPSRKFFSNEVMRVPLYEAVPVELIITHCWVMDLNTFCKGRPIGAPEEHIYICEYRVDKSARLFSKVSKSKFPICTKSFIFERFESRLKVSRTYTPHDLDPAVVKPRGRKPIENDDREAVLESLPVHVPIIRTREERKTRLNKILLNLLSQMPSKQTLDVSYLLEGGRRRKKIT